MLRTYQRFFAFVAILSAFLTGLAGAQPARAAEQQCFAQTKQCIEGRFLQFWRDNGGLPVFGYPITAAREERNSDTGKTYLTQWFERNRFEYHPENRAPYDVLLGRLGEDELRSEGLRWQEFMSTQREESCLWFAETRQRLCDDSAPFKTYWESHGLQDRALNAYQRSLALFGMPLSSPQPETNAAGDTVVTQWFERARFEYHPNNPAGFRVLLGLLGGEVRGAPPAGPRTLPADALWIHTMDKVRAIGPPAAFVTLAKGQGLDYVATAPDGSLVVYYQHTTVGQEGGKLWALDPRTGQRRVLYEVPSTVFRARFSPDGSRLAVAVVRAIDSWQLVELDMRTGRSRVMQHGTDQAFLAPIAWTRAGLLVTRVRWGDAPPEDLMMINPETGATRRLYQGEHLGAAISDDGKRIAVTTGNSGMGGTQPEMSLAIVATDTGRETVLISKTKQVLSLVGWSPDSARFAYRTFDADQNVTLHVVNADGSDRQSLAFPQNGATGRLMDAMWRDRATLVVLTASGKESRVYHAPLNAFTGAGLKRIGSFAGGLEAPAFIVYSPRS